MLINYTACHALGGEQSVDGRRRKKKEEKEEKGRKEWGAGYGRGKAGVKWGRRQEWRKGL